MPLSFDRLHWMQSGTCFPLPSSARLALRALQFGRSCLILLAWLLGLGGLFYTASAAMWGSPPKDPIPQPLVVGPPAALHQPPKIVSEGGEIGSLRTYRDLDLNHLMVPHIESQDGCSVKQTYCSLPSVGSERREQPSSCPAPTKENCHPAMGPSDRMCRLLILLPRKMSLSSM